LFLQSETYKVSRHFDPVFEKVALELSRRPNVNLKRFVEAQIKYMLARGLIEKLFPSIMSGSKAFDRYIEAPSEKQEELDILQSLQSQAQCFASVCKTMGEDFAFASTVVDYTPLFMAYMRWTVNRDIPPVLRANASAELRIKPLAAKFFPSEYLGYLRS
jgi:hypothetical protein